MKRCLALALVLLVGLGACATDRITSSEQGLVLEASISDARIGPGETAILAYRLVNASGEMRTLQTSDSCTLLLHVEVERGPIVHGPGGCYEIYPPPVTLQPGEEIARTDGVTRGPGIAYNGSVISLPPGHYRAYVEYNAVLVDTGKSIELRSRAVPFEVE